MLIYIFRVIGLDEHMSKSVTKSISHSKSPFKSPKRSIVRMSNSKTVKKIFRNEQSSKSTINHYISSSNKMVTMVVGSVAEKIIVKSHSKSSLHSSSTKQLVNPRLVALSQPKISIPETTESIKYNMPKVDNFNYLKENNLTSILAKKGPVKIDQKRLARLNKLKGSLLGLNSTPTDKYDDSDEEVYKPTTLAIDNDSDFESDEEEESIFNQKYTREFIDRKMRF